MHLACSGLLAAGSRIALYASVGSEVATQPLLQLAHARGCAISLPRIRDRQAHRMDLARMSLPLRTGAHGIPAPPPAATRMDPRRLAVIFMPLLGFDARGMRLGSGAGYYDRLLATLGPRTAPAPPLLVGLAFACQQLAHIAATPHDVALDLVCTEDGLIHCQPES